MSPRSYSISSSSWSASVSSIEKRAVLPASTRSVDAWEARAPVKALQCEVDKADDLAVECRNL